MFSFAVLLAVITAVLIDGANSSSLQIDIDSVLEAIQQQNQQSRYRSNRQDDRNDRQDDRNDNQLDDDNNRSGSLRSQEIIELIQRAADARESRHNSKQRGENYKSYHENDRNRNNRPVNYENRQQYNIDDNILEQLLSKEKPAKSKRRPSAKKPRHLVPNALLGSPYTKNDEATDITDFSKYSKIYIILNPQAIRNSKNKNELHDLLSNVINSSANDQRHHQDKQKEYRYKGFSLKDGLLARRSRRDSGNSMEDDYRPKRGRNDHGGGGGGGGGGRTAIPYIRHRGDIYERDN